MCPSVGRTAIGAPKDRRERERRQQQFLSPQVLDLRVGRSVVGSLTSILPASPPPFHFTIRSFPPASPFLACLFDRVTY